MILTLAMLGVIAGLLFERGGVAASVTASEQRADAQAYAADGGYAHAKSLLGLASGCAALPTLSNAPFGPFTYSATFTPGATAQGPLLLFQSVADSWLKSADDDANFGNENDLKNKRKSGDHEETVIRFDLTLVTDEPRHRVGHPLSLCEVAGYLGQPDRDLSRRQRVVRGNGQLGQRGHRLRRGSRARLVRDLALPASSARI